MERSHQPVKAEFVLGPHRDNDFGKLSFLKTVIERALIDQHHILVAVENADGTDFTARALELCINKFGRLPSQVEAAIYQQPSSEIVRMLDGFFITHPQSLQIMYEGLPEEALNPRSAYWKSLSFTGSAGIRVGKNLTNDWCNRRVALATKKSFSGKFEEALACFKPPVLSMALDVFLRETYLDSRIKERLDENPDITFITGYWGCNHTGIIHLLRRQGVSARAIFCDNEDGKYHFDPCNSLIRKIRFGRATTTLDWEKALLGTAFQKLMIITDSQLSAETQATEQQINCVTHQTLSKLGNDEIFQDFKQRLFSRRFSSEHWFDTWASLVS